MLGGGRTAVGRVRWGDLRRTAPFDRNWGYGRGTPVDRVYIEMFLEEHAADVRGACLEVLNPTYTHRFGGDRVLFSDVLDLDPANLKATVISDLGENGSLPEDRYDCFILTQTIHLVPDMAAAMMNAHRTLVPGGVLLLTVPGIGRHESRQGFEHDRWRLTPTGLSWLLESREWEDRTVTSFGNVLTATAMLFGLAAEELKPQELTAQDLDYPLVVACRAVKASG
jgi:SAM-dependent methyltransferase